MLAASDLAHLPRIHDISIDPAVLVFTLGISLAAGLLFGLIPVLKYARPHLSSALRSGGRSLSQSKERHRARSLLVVVQVALALVLLVGSGLMIRTFQALRHVDPGFSGAHEMETLAHFDSRDAGHRTRARDSDGRGDPTQDGGDRGCFRVAQSPAIFRWKAARTIRSMRRIGRSRRARFRPYGVTNSSRQATFPRLARRLIAGRDLTWTETYNQTPVALVSENMARELWRDPRAALGKRIRPGLKDDWREVIGVVADLRDDGVDQKAPAIVYWPLLQKNFEASASHAYRSVAFVIRTPRAGIGGIASGPPTSRRQREPESAGSGRQRRWNPYMTAPWRAPRLRWCCWRSRAAWRCFWA